MFMSDKRRMSYQEFLNYIYKPLSYQAIENLNIQNKIEFDRAQLYYDFICGLQEMVFDTYIENIPVIDHFNWCWNSIIDHFQREHINFKREGEHYFYFLNHFSEVFYEENVVDKDKHKSELYHFWSDLFNQNRTKPKSHYDIFVEVYYLFDDHLIISV